MKYKKAMLFIQDMEVKTSTITCKKNMIDLSSMNTAPKMLQMLTCLSM